MSDFYDFFVRFLPDLLKGAGITLVLTLEGFDPVLPRRLNGVFPPALYFVVAEKKSFAS